MFSTFLRVKCGFLLRLEIRIFPSLCITTDSACSGPCIPGQQTCEHDDVKAQNKLAGNIYSLKYSRQWLWRREKKKREKWVIVRDTTGEGNRIHHRF
jgi:hypothetical protein